MAAFTQEQETAITNEIERVVKPLKELVDQVNA